MIERILALIAEKNISAYKVAKDLNFSHSLFTSWRSKGSVPDTSTLIKIADYLDVSVDYLLGREPLPTDSRLTETEVKLILDPTNKRVLELFEPLGRRQKERVINILEEFNELTQKYSELTDSKKAN